MTTRRQVDETRFDFTSEPFTPFPSYPLPSGIIGKDPSDKPLQVTLNVSGQYRSLSPRLRYKILLPTLVVFTLTSGLGVAVLAWLFSRRKIPLAEAFKLGYILVDEGVRHSGTMESATLRALTATSFISTFITSTSPILMMLVAYRISSLWMEEQRNPVHGLNTGPTPLQYGLLLQVLGAPSIMSLTAAARYLLKGKTRPRAPSYFSTSVILGIIIYVIVHLVGLADLWLHATTSAVLFNLTTPDSSISAPMASVTFNESLCTASDFPPINNICITGADGWANYQEEFMTTIGQNVISNSSSDQKVITLANAADLSLVVPQVVDKRTSFKASNFGVRAQCQSLNSQCIGQGTTNPVDCSNIGITVIPTNNSVIASVVLVAPYTKWNDTPPDLDTSYPRAGPHRCCGANPTETLLQLRWSSQVNGNTRVPNNAVQPYPIPLLSIYASCKLTFYNLRVAYDGSAIDEKYWSIIPEDLVPSNDRFATTLMAPYAWQLVTDHLTMNIKSRAMSANSTEQVMAALNQELSRLALGYVSGAFIFTPARDVRIINPTILGRYPLAPLLVFIILLFIYGLIGTMVFVASFHMCSDTVLVPPELRHNTHPTSEHGDQFVSSLELFQPRLTSPLPVLAQLFAEPIDPSKPPGPEDADTRSASAKLKELFAESNSLGYPEYRLRIGLQKSDVRPRFGIWRD